MITTMLTLQIQIEIKSKNNREYQKERDEMIEAIEDMGFSVDIQDETDEDGI